MVSPVGWGFEVQFCSSHILYTYVGDVEITIMDGVAGGCQ
jgi:hypothetical protein